MIASGEDKEIIENLVTSYIQRPSCIVLQTIACESKGQVIAETRRTHVHLVADWENQKGFDLAQTHDPDGKRTIGTDHRL